MMNIYLMIAVVLANFIGIAIVYQFIKKLEKKEKLIFIAVSIAIMYILVSIVYWFSGFGIEEEVHEASKNFVLYLFVPVNMILFVPYIASKYMKLRQKEIDIQYLANKLSIVAVLLIIVLIIEYFYFKNIQKNIADINNTMNEIQEERTIEENIIKNNVEVNSKSNELTNQITNEIENNHTTNAITNQISNNIVDQVQNGIANQVQNNITNSIN